MQAMAASCNIPLIFHGAVILLLSQVAGYALFFAIKRSPQDATRVGMWRMSHAACSAGAVFLIALGPVVPHLPLSPGLFTFLVDTLIVSTYGLSVGTVVAGFSGHRGMSLKLPWSNRIASVLYLIGVLGSTLSGLVLMYGAVLAYMAP
jgi:hypothetical protein